jgi:1-pyrroline-5-carboxylate dehydrogenase
MPPGVINIVTGGGAEVGDPLCKHPKVGGIVFTGSMEVGYGILKHISERPYPIPTILELGGKNPVIITPKGDLAKAVSGVVNATFGYGGQKCSACSRVYVHKSVAKEFTDQLVKAMEGFKVADPRKKESRFGPVIHTRAVQDFLKASEMAQKDGKIIVGGQRLTADGMDRGNFVAPTIVTGLPDDHYLVKNELFLPFLVIQEYENFEKVMDQANDVVFGLTGGIYTSDPVEIDYFLDHMKAGTVFVNGKRGATNGAIVGTHAFGGWKASGSTGRGSGDVYYLLQFLRQQSRTILP